MLRYGSTLLVTALALAPVSARAQSLSSPDVRTAYAEAMPRTDARDPNVYLLRGEKEMEAWNLSGARRDFLRALRLQRGEGVFPERSLWHLATLAHTRGDYDEAARHLDDLAAEAETHGRPDVQAKALFEAAVIHQRLGAAHEVRIRMERLHPLLDSSPFLSTSLRESIRQRIRR